MDVDDCLPDRHRYLQSDVAHLLHDNQSHVREHVLLVAGELEVVLEVGGGGVVIEVAGVIVALNVAAQFELESSQSH